MSLKIFNPCSSATTCTVFRVPEQLFEHVVHVLLPVLALQEAAGALLVSYRILNRK
jgi:hypothetical protein